MKVTKSHKYRLYPNVKQQVLLAKTFGCTRVYWNNLVNSFNAYNRESNPKVILKSSKEIRSEFKWMKEISAASLQQKYRDFEQFKKTYFQKLKSGEIEKLRKKHIANKLSKGLKVDFDKVNFLGKPNFKKKSSSQSYRLPNQKFKIVGNKIQLEKIGKVSVNMERGIPENAKLLSVTVSKNPSGQYFASVNFEIEQKVKQKRNNENIGIDLGVSAIATLSDGLQFSNPRTFRENQSKLRIAQKHLSRKQKNSNRYKKQKLKVAKIHNKITNQRDWHLHNISRWIVENFNEIGMEDLAVSNMVKNRKLCKAISDSSMSKLKQFITYKQIEYGKEVKLLNRFAPSTKECSGCGYVQKMKLSDREFVCVSCGEVKLNRDLNAAINIRNKTVGVTAVKQTWRKNKTKLHENVIWQILGSVENNNGNICH